MLLGCRPGTTLDAMDALPSGGSLASHLRVASVNLVSRCITSCVVVPSSRVEPRWELGACVGKMELTDEHLHGTLSGIPSSRTIHRLPKSHCFNKDAMNRIVGTPTNSEPDGAARDPQVRRQ